jgi:predicted nucleotidyltransferase
MLLPAATLPVDRIAEICRRYQVRELALFGSAARDDMKPDSDIDLLVEFLPNAWIGLFEFAAMERELAGLLGRRVDLVSKRGLKPRVRPHVLQDAKVLYAA